MTLGKFINFPESWFSHLYKSKDDSSSQSGGRIEQQCGNFPPKLGCESEVSKSCPTLCDPMDCNLSGYSDHGIFQARMLEWVA